MNKTHEKKVWNIVQITLLVAPLLICILVFTIIPIILTFQKSLKFYPYQSNKTIYSYNFGNYKNIFNDPQFGSAILNTTLALFLGTATSMILALIFAIIVEHLVSKRARSAFLTLIYSQFFISSFAVGIAFTMFFGSKSLFFKLIRTEYGFTSGSKRLPIWLYYSIFQTWRSLPFNLVLFASAINRGNIKYTKLSLNDKLTIWQKTKYIYFNEIQKVFFAILFTNFIFAALLLPDAIVEKSYNIDVHQAHTLTSYTIKFAGGGANPVLKFEKGYASAFFSFAYLVFLLMLILMLLPSSIRKFIRFIKFKKTKRNKAKVVKNEL
ncbi:glycerol ABC transporter permease [Mycoplasmopsis californica]|uniref:Glycerol ABC transporter permease n=2 Tax=Mycoplasmopsis californica TaxID=2113 RepID=A0A059XV78_9BACT|nr:sugar ABC transporter permease [Mycoplasmopsis californica]AIA29226.1 glycerol ABC transporter permease [Mycoplasmopsis californica]